jgi:hypothetical protein
MQPAHSTETDKRIPEKRKKKMCYSARLCVCGVLYLLAFAMTAGNEPTTDKPSGDDDGPDMIAIHFLRKYLSCAVTVCVLYKISGKASMRLHCQSTFGT